MNKRFLTADEFLQDCWQLGRLIERGGWRPTHLVGLWRGGAPVAVAVHEWLLSRGMEMDHCVVRTRSYTAIGEQTPEVAVDGIEYLVRVLRADSRLLLVDDIHDSGRSLAAVIAALGAACGRQLPREIRRATLYHHPEHGAALPPPDYHVHETDCWVVFPHELVGLTAAEVERHKPAAAKGSQSE